MAKSQNGMINTAEVQAIFTYFVDYFREGFWIFGFRRFSYCLGHENWGGFLHVVDF
jgi:hypothetical protein